MVQVGDQRGERVVGPPADSGLAGGAGVIPRHRRRGNPDPLQLIIFECEAVGAPTDAEPAQTGTLQRQERVRFQREKLVHVADHVLPVRREVRARPSLIAQHRDRVVAEKIGVLVGVGAADFGKRLGRVESLRLVVGITDFDQGDFAAAGHRFHSGMRPAGARAHNQQIELWGRGHVIGRGRRRAKRSAPGLAKPCRPRPSHPGRPGRSPQKESPA